MTVARSGATFRYVFPIRSRTVSSSPWISRRTSIGACPSATRRANRCTTLCTIAIAGWAWERRRAASRRSAGSLQAGPSSVARAIVSRATRARRDALLFRSPAIPSIASSTTGPNTFQPLMIRRESLDAYAYPLLQKILRVPFRGATTHVVQLPHHSVLPRGGEALLDDARPRRVGGEHRLDCLPRIPVRAVVAEEQGPRSEGQQASQRLQVLLEIERRRRGDRQEDLVAREVQAGRIARVHASIPLVQDRELVRRVAGRVEEDQGMLSEF